MKIGDCKALLDKCTDRESTPFSVDGIINLAIESADFDDVSAYRLAIADVIHDHFSRWIAIDPEAKAKLKVAGGHISESGFQLIMLQFGWESYQLAKSRAKGMAGVLEGFFVLNSKVVMLQGERADRVEGVREMIFSIFSDIQKELAHLKGEN